MCNDASALPSVNLAAAIPQGGEWDNVKRWVVFSDLHVSHKTVDIACQVLRRVRKEAEARDAGVLFLGDFWHVRGSLPVGPLNRVLEEFRQWRQPTLMLVGNHDQSTIGGLEHGLTPLAEACAALHVFDRPTEWGGALWLPYRRQRAELEAAIRGATGTVKAVFGHADVIGAFVNETFQAREGFMPDLFPEGVPTFMGHYHKPHTVQGTSIQYVGSPFQVSRSETGQQKALLVLDSDWRETDRIPLDIGPRFHTLSSAQPDFPADLRSGDRVRWTLPDSSHLESAEGTVQELQSKGIEVEVLAPPPVSAPRIEASEEAGAMPLFQLYADHVGMSAAAVAIGSDILRDLADKGASIQTEGATIELHSMELEGFGPYRDLVQYGLSNRGIRVITGSNLDDDGTQSNGAGKSVLVMAPLWALTGRSDARSEGGSTRGLTMSDIVNDDCKAARVRIDGAVNGRSFTVERTTRRKALAGLTFQLDGEDLTGADARLTQAQIERRLAIGLLARASFHGQADITSLLEADDRKFKDELGRVIEMDIWDAAKAKAAERLKGTKRQLTELDSEARVRQELLANLQSQVQDAEQRSVQWEETLQRRQAAAKEAGQAAAEQLLADARELQDCCMRLEAWLTANRQEVAAQDSLADALSGSANGTGDIPGRASSVLVGGNGNSRAGAPHLAPEHRKVAAPQAATAVASREQEELTQLQCAHQALQNRLLLERSQLGSATAALQASQRQVQEYSQLLQSPSNGAHEHVSGALCDRCLQPIDEATFRSNLQRLGAEADSAAAAHRAVAERASATQREVEVARARVDEAQQALIKELDRAKERERQAAAERAAASRDWAVQEQAAARDRAAAQRAMQAAAAQVATAESMLQQAHQTLQRWWELLGGVPAATPADCGKGANGNIALVCQTCSYAIQRTESTGRRLEQLQAATAAAAAERNPHKGEAAQLSALAQEASAKLAAVEGRRGDLGHQVSTLAELDAGFGRTGVQSYALEGILGELQERTQQYLEQLASGFSLRLSASRPAAAAPSTAVERITKSVLVRSRDPATGQTILRERSLRQLSGGERRRVALALVLGFAELISARGRLRCNLMVLDEVLQQLDEEGCARVAAVLRCLPHSTVLLVGQASTYVAQTFDAVDVVVKQGGRTTVEVAP
ncbi:hypothetical protein WJX75_001641 [Coccomyxa subellipsoidea]|uniref:Rad50/SbcC-type AAA domain-containing protein n=1 Tax=Coccomyxa subellipsoidea TaxID=248742 RepID=A0ABR2YT57_9CHLO